VKVELVRASESDEPTLANLLHLHIHDFSEFLGMTPSEQGWFSYASLPLTWKEVGRAAFLVRAADRLVGFALISRGSLVSREPHVRDVTEFFVVRGIRRRGVGCAAAHELFRTEAGVWEVRVIDSNRPAQHFWRRVIEQYTKGRFSVEPWTRDDGSEWHVFRFTSPGAGAAGS
jgi:predicted acetyltransferase